MELAYILALPLLLLLTRLVLVSSSSKNNNKKKLPPSPPALPFIGHLYLFERPLHRALRRLSDRYGPVILLRFGSRPVLVVSSPAAAEECFTKNDVAFANRPRLPTAKYLSFNYNALGNASYGPHWRNMRRIATVEVLSSHRIASFADARSAEARSMARRLFAESAAKGSGTVELKSRLFELALNIMMTMVAGKRYFYEGAAPESEREEARRFREMVEESFSLSGASNLRDFLPLLRVVDLQGLKKRLVRLERYRNDFLQGLIDEKRRESEDQRDETTTTKKDMISVLLSLQKTDAEYYTDDIIKAIMISLLTAGTDTSSNTIEWAMALLLNNPEKLKKAEAEMDAQIPNGRLIQESDLSGLPYLHCIITETLRLYPAGPLLVPHESSEHCVVGGFDVPPGTMLLVNAYSIQRDPNLWPDPTGFVPERFESHGGEGPLMIPFGMGRRRCPGEVLAMREVGLVLGTLIQCFEWERIGGEEVDMTEGSGLTMPKAVPLEARFCPRQKMVDALSGLST